MTDRFYSYDPDEGFEEHNTADEASDRAEAALEACREQAPDGWPEEVHGIHWGRILPLETIVETRGTQEQDAYAQAKGCSYWCDYHLAAQPDELAQLRAQVKALESHELAVAEAVGIVYEADGHAPAPGPCDQVVAEIKRLRTEARDVYELRQRIAELDALQGQRDELRAQAKALTAERDKARADYAYVVERVADQRLDGYRELGARAAAAENERDALLGRVEWHAFAALHLDPDDGGAATAAGRAHGSSSVIRGTLES